MLDSLPTLVKVYNYLPFDILTVLAFIQTSLGAYREYRYFESRYVSLFITDTF
jgi:hypothetical protein